MMKKNNLKTKMISAAVAIAMIAGLVTSPQLAYGSDETYTKMSGEELLAEVKSGALEEDITLTDGMTIQEDVTIDLGGNTLYIDNGAISVQKGTVTVKNGAVVNKTGHVFRVEANDADAGAKLNIEKDVQVTAEKCCVFIKKEGSVLNTYGTLTATGEYAAIQGNGSTGNGGIEVNILGGQIIAEDVAVYFPNTTTLNISDGEILGLSAVYHKSGILNISGGTLIGDGDKADYVHNSNGCDATGDALIIEACDYPGGVPEVNITGGTFVSEKANAIGYYKQSESYKLANEKFISGGSFSSLVTDYTADRATIKLATDVTVDKLTVNEQALTIDLDGHKLKFTEGGNSFAKNANVTLKNGTINIDGIDHKDNAIFNVGNYSTTAQFTLEGIVLEGTNYSSPYAVIYAHNTSVVNIDNCEFTLSDEQNVAGGVIKGNAGTADSKIYITDSVLDFTDTLRGFVDGTIEIKNSTVKMTGTNGTDSTSYLDNGFNGTLNLTIDNSKVEIVGCTGRAFTLAKDGVITVKNGSEVTLKGREDGEADIRFKGVGRIYIDASSSMKFGVVKTDNGVDAALCDLIMLSEETNELLNSVSGKRAVEVGKTVELIDTFTTNKNVAWETSDSDVATVENGVVTAVAKGTTTITVTALNGLSETCEIVVYEVKTAVLDDEEDGVADSVNEETIEIVKDLVTTDDVADSYAVVNGLISEETAQAVKDAVEAGETITSEVYVEAISEEDIDDEVKKAIKENANEVIDEDVTLMYLDVSIFLKAGDEVLGTINELDNEIEITVKIPENFDAAKGKIVVLRMHNGEVKVLDATVNEDGTITFVTDCFSTYALAYVAVNKTALKDAIDKCEKDALVKDNYTTESWTNYEAAITNAKLIYAKEDATQEEVDKAVTLIEEATKGLVAASTDAKTDTTAGSETVQTGDTANISLYVTLLVAAFAGMVAVFVAKKRKIIKR